MISLNKVEKITDDLIQKFELSKGDQLYECYLSNIKIGYAIIRKKVRDELFIIIAQKYQNKGYGSAVFKLLLSKVNKSVICSVSFDNVKMQRIIQKNNGIEIGRNGKEIAYIIENRTVPFILAE